MDREREVGSCASQLKALDACALQYNNNNNNVTMKQNYMKIDICSKKNCRKTYLGTFGEPGGKDCCELALYSRWEPSEI
jgi:hypothetical protein